MCAQNAVFEKILYVGHTSLCMLRIRRMVTSKSPLKPSCDAISICTDKNFEKTSLVYKMNSKCGYS